MSEYNFGRDERGPADHDDDLGGGEFGGGRSAPVRDARGRFVKGASGNRYGRPRRPRRGTADRIYALMTEPQPIKVGGKKVMMTPEEVMLRKLITGLMTASPTDALKIFEKLERLGLYNMLDNHKREIDRREADQREWQRLLDASVQATLKRHIAFDEAEAEQPDSGADAAGENEERRDESFDPGGEDEDWADYTEEEKEAEAALRAFERKHGRFEFRP